MSPSPIAAQIIRSNHEDRVPGPDLPVETLVRLAHHVLDTAGVRLSPSKVSKVARTYKHQVEPNGYPFLAYLVAAIQLTADQRQRVYDDPDTRKVIPWADPTGETAARHADRGRGGAA